MAAQILCLEPSPTIRAVRSHSSFNMKRSIILMTSSSGVHFSQCWDASHLRPLMSWQASLPMSLVGMRSRKRPKWRVRWLFWRTGMGSDFEAGGGKKRPMNLSIVVPVYRGEKLVEPLVERLGKALPTFAEKYEVILVNDGSPDSSWADIEQLAKKHNWIKGVGLMRNYSQQNATLCGIRAARYEVTVTMDQDLQHPPENIPILL